MARTSLNVIQFSDYNQAIYPFDYYEECESGDTGAIKVVAENASTGEINYNDVLLIDSDGNALYSEAPTGKYVVKVLGFYKVVDGTTLEAEFTMSKDNEKYLLVVNNKAKVATYYAECEETDDGAISVKASGATGDDEINYNDSALVDYTGTALYTEAPIGKFVKAYSGTKSITIKKGNSVQHLFGDETYSILYNNTYPYFIRLESGIHKNVYGTDKGKVIISATDTLVEMAILCFL